MILLGSYEYKRIFLTQSLDAHIPLVSLYQNMNRLFYTNSFLKKEGLGTGELGQTVKIEMCFRELITDNCTTMSDGVANAVFRGVGQIFFCDSVLAGLIILGGIALSSRSVMRL